jgi:hypothetical protein
MELSRNSDSFEVGERVYAEIKEVLTLARGRAYAAVNFTMVEAYWQIGKRIVEEQGNESRAEYGTQLLKYLSLQLTRDFGRGFEERELRRMRQFYLLFPIEDRRIPSQNRIRHDCRSQFGTHCAPN